MRLLGIGLFAIVAWAGAAPLHAQQSFTFFASLVDGKGVAPTTLNPDDVRVQENGADGRVLKIEPVDWPVRVTLLIDNGTAMSQALAQIRVGAKGLIEALPSGVETSLVTTAPQPRNIVRPTKDRLALLQGVDRISPDSGAPRFIEALIEAANRIDRENREKGNFFPVIVMLGSTAAEGSSIVERDIEKMLRQLTDRAVTVHVVMLSSGGQSSTGGANQIQLGLAVTKQTGGRYESIAATSRLATLLPEIGEQVARSHARQSRQFRLTFQRPSGASGPVGAIGMMVPAGYTPTLTIDGRLP